MASGDLHIQNMIDHLTNAHAELKLAAHAAEDSSDEDQDFINDLVEQVSDLIDDLREEVEG